MVAMPAKITGDKATTTTTSKKTRHSGRVIESKPRRSVSHHSEGNRNWIATWNAQNKLIWIKMRMTNGFVFQKRHFMGLTGHCCVHRDTATTSTDTHTQKMTKNTAWWTRSRYQQKAVTTITTWQSKKNYVLYVLMCEEKERIVKQPCLCGQFYYLRSSRTFTQRIYEAEQPKRIKILLRRKIY